jgi:carbonyl reductase 1
VTLDTNFVGTARVCDTLLAKTNLMPTGARIVNVCSSAGKLSIVPSEDLQRKFLAATSYDDVAALADGFVAAIAKGTHQQQGWPSSMYGMSKLCESIYSHVLAQRVKDRGIAVIPCNPGYTSTDMTSGKGYKTAAQGADTPVWLALQPPSQLEAASGKFYSDRQEQPL